MNIQLEKYEGTDNQQWKLIQSGNYYGILNEIKEGDYLLVQFEINDSPSSKAERYAPACGNIPGAEGSFEYYMTKYIEGAKAVAKLVADEMKKQGLV